MKQPIFSRFWPCKTLFYDGWCGGIGALIGNLYQCNRCAHAWDRNGDPVRRS